MARTKDSYLKLLNGDEPTPAPRTAPKEYDPNKQRKSLSGYQMQDRISRSQVIKQQAKTKDYFSLFGWTPRYNAYAEAGKKSFDEYLRMMGYEQPRQYQTTTEQNYQQQNMYPDQPDNLSAIQELLFGGNQKPNYDWLEQMKIFKMLDQYDLQTGLKLGEQPPAGGGWGSSWGGGWGGGGWGSSTYEKPKWYNPMVNWIIGMRNWSKQNANTGSTAGIPTG